MHKPEVELIGHDGNAFAILGKVSKVLRVAERKGEVEPGTADKYLAEAKQGDYDHLLSVTMEYVEVV